MSPINEISLGKKLELLEEVAKVLEEINKSSKKDFFADPVINGAAMHYLVQGIEIITDIGNHLLNEVFRLSTDGYKDTILKLGKTKIIPVKFAKDNADMAGFRNILIHAYSAIDLNEVYDNLQKAPDIFGKFAGYYVEFLKKIKTK